MHANQQAISKDARSSAVAARLLEFVATSIALVFSTVCLRRLLRRPCPGKRQCGLCHASATLVKLETLVRSRQRQASQPVVGRSASTSAVTLSTEKNTSKSVPTALSKESCILGIGRLAIIAAIILTAPGQLIAAVPADHRTDRSGVMHAEDNDLPFTSRCTDCHAPDLRGGLGPSCYSCHSTLWAWDDTSNQGPPSDHTESRGVGALHKPGQDAPFDNGCTQCHGENLNDGFAPSCFSCHGPYWASDGPPEDHTETLLGFAEHKPGYGDPITNGCTQCHGPNLNDGFATACSDCHGPVWEGTDGHHMPGRSDPWNLCTTCHGAELLGDTFGDVTTPACDSCHNSFEPPDAPPSGHNRAFPGFDHTSFNLDDRLSPYSKCSTCHGDPDTATGGFPPGCQTCHGTLWGEQNLPPDVDVGGPYQGIKGEPVAFDASGTTDAELDPLLYQWDFGDGSPVTAASQDPTATHSYAQAGSYNAVLSVSDSVNDPVAEGFVVTVSEDGSDGWTVTTTTVPPETFGITFTSDSGSLLGTRDDGGLAMGIEFPGVIFWMDLTVSQLWDGGDLYFGNIDRQAGTMAGIVFEGDGTVATYTATKD